MNVHKNARTTANSRALLVHRVVHQHWPVSAVAMAFGISERTVYKWLARYRAQGAAGLLDRSSVARRRPHALGGVWLALITPLQLTPTRKPSAPASEGGFNSSRTMV